jgi:hypothetical protein
MEFCNELIFFGWNGFLSNMTELIAKLKLILPVISLLVHRNELCPFVKVNLNAKLLT